MNRTWIIAFMLIYLILPSQAFSQERNQCDDLYREDGRNDVLLEACHERHGHSDWFQNMLAESQRRQLVRDRLHDAITVTTFSAEEIRNEVGFGVSDIISGEYVYDERGNLKKRNPIMSAQNLCQKLGYDVMISAYHSRELPGGSFGHDLLYFERPRRNQEFQLRTWDWEGLKNAQIFQEVTCAKSDIEDNEILERMVEHSYQAFFNRESSREPIEPELVDQDPNRIDNRVDNSSRYNAGRAPARHTFEGLRDYFGQGHER